jgi:hypothetical protein
MSKGADMSERVYLAGKITGDDNYRRKFAVAEEKLKGLGYRVMNPAILPDGWDYESYIRISMCMLRECEAVCLLADWTESRGAIAEFNAAVDRNMVIMNYEMIA